MSGEFYKFYETCSKTNPEKVMITFAIICAIETVDTLMCCTNLHVDIFIYLEFGKILLKYKSLNKMNLESGN